MAFTEEQIKAIETVGDNVLVAAAAGSGKTEILTSRIKHIILHEDEDIKADIDRMLVLTFTNEAAAEMKQRIGNNIREEIKNSPENRIYLQKQLALMMDANISTFHSFAQKIIKKYFYKLGIDPKVKVIDQDQGLLLKMKAMDNSFNEFFSAEDLREREGFKDFLKRFSSPKNERQIKNELIDFYDKLMSFPNPFNRLEKAYKNLLCDHEEYTQALKLDLFNVIVKEFNHILKYLEEMRRIFIDSNISSLDDKVGDEIQSILGYIDQADSNNFLETIDSFFSRDKNFNINWKRISTAKKDEKESFSSIKEEVDSLKDLMKPHKERLNEILVHKNFDQVIFPIKETYDTGFMLYKIMYKFHKEYRFLKDNNKAIDFSDIEHFAIAILSDSSIADEYREKFKYIFIDEYQDTNDIQEYIISLIKRDNNLFMVGDLKQSIYRFRLAEPEIFQNKYKSFTDYRKADEVTNIEGIKIDLNKNFRSKNQVLDYVNSVFESNMDNYDENARLNCGLIYDNVCEDEGFLSRKAKLILVEKDIEDMEEALEEDVEYNNKTREAIAIAKEIKKILGKYYIDKNNKKRKISYKDITVLTKSRSAYEEFKQVFNKFGIPVSISNNKGYFDKIEIQILVDILKVIQNKNQEIPFLSVITNWIFNFTPEDLLKIRLHHENDKFIKAFNSYIKSGEEEYLVNKCKDVNKQIRSWRKEIKSQSLESFLWKLINNTGIYQYVLTLDNGNQRQVNIRAFIEKVKNYEKFSQGSLYGLLEYIDNLKKKDVDVGEASTVSDKDDVVKLMTIHASKGKQFPVVFLANTHSKFRSVKNPIGEYFFLSKDDRLFIKNVYLKKGIRKDNLLKSLLEYEELRKNLEEEVRVLYVAMTRARDKLIISGVTKIEEERFKGIKSQLDMIFNGINYNFLDLEQITQGDDLLLEVENNQEEIYIEDTQNISYDSQKLRNLISFTYPYEKDAHTRSKFSVSELNSKNKEDILNFELDLNIFNEREIDNSLSSTERGSLYHLVMEEIDFEKYRAVGKEAIYDTIEDLNKRKLYQDPIEELISVEKIEDFFKHDLGKRVLEHKSVKEKSFRMLYEFDGGSTIVQGIIDCYFEDDDGSLVLIDYKSNKYSNNIRQQYQLQMNLYREALEKATGKKVKEAWLYLINESRAVDIN